MKRLFAGVAVLGLALVVGCTKETANGKDPLSLKAPTGATELKQGDKQDVKLAMERGKDFKDEVTVKVEAPKGITVEPESKVMAAADKELALKVAAAADAPEGKQTVTVTATPKGGKAVTTKFDVNVKKAGDKAEKPEKNEKPEGK